MSRASYVWVRKPLGPIPKAVQESLRARLAKHVRAKWQGRCREVAVRFRGGYAYIDAYPAKRDDLSRASPEERAIIDATPIHLCRLGYLGTGGVWEYAFFKYSDEKYALSLVASGSFEATPEQAFDCAAGVYLHG